MVYVLYQDLMGRGHFRGDVVQGGVGESAGLCQIFLTLQVPFFRKGRVNNLNRFFRLATGLIVIISLTSCRLVKYKGMLTSFYKMKKTPRG